MTPNWRAVVGALLIGCILGLWAGAALGHRRHAPPGTDRMLDKFSRDLKLEPGQRGALRTILEGYSGKFDSLHADAEARFSELRAAMNADISKLLDPEQQKRFQEKQARWDSRHKRRR